MSTTSARLIEKRNPATGELIATYPAFRPNEVRRVVERSRQALSQWRATSLKERAALLKRLSDALYAQADELAAIISEETGKPFHDALEADIGTALNTLNYYAEVGPSVLKNRRIQPDLISLITGRSHVETAQPRGVIGIISPWNYPLAIPVSGIAATLMSGNTAILKPSELTPATGHRLSKLFRKVINQAGLPEDILQCVIGDGATGAALVNDEVDGLIFTGGTQTGRWIREALTARGIWHSLELGGSDAMIILPGCNLEHAASYAVWGRFVNTGQACASVKRLYVPKQHLETVLKHLQSKIAQLRVGLPGDAKSHLGPLINEAQLERVDEQVQDALAHGATLLTGGKRLENETGYFYEPTLLCDVPNDARVLQEEVFGPVLPVIAYETIEDAIRQANATPFGLTISIFGPAGKARQLAGQLHCATVVINDVGASNYAMACAPWGGWKDSGTGASHGERALRELSRWQVISTNSLFEIPGFQKPLWHFGKSEKHLGKRSKAVLAFSGRRAFALNPVTWLAFWLHRAGTKI